MDHQNITDIGDFSSISEELKKVTDIDLTGNHLESWEDVSTLLLFYWKISLKTFTITDFQFSSSLSKIT